MSTGTGLIALGAFLARRVEMVEALTIVLGVGTVRGWRSTLIGVGAATVVLAMLIAVLGPALQHIPLDSLRFVVGALLLVFGLQWLRKAILRSSGFKALHDESLAFAHEVREGGTAGRGGGQGGGGGAPRPRLVRLHALVQGRAARRARGRIHRPHLRERAGEHPARGRPRRRRAPAGGGGRGARPSAARARPREHDQVRGRDDAHDLRPLLVGRG